MGSIEGARASTLFPKITGKCDEFVYNIERLRSSIESFSKLETISLVGTVKLHGAHADIVIQNDNTITIQSRNQPCLSVEKNKDVNGVAAFLLPQRATILDLKARILARFLEINPGEKADDTCPLIIAGEWIGPGIQKKVAINELPAKVFVIISININDTWQDDELFADIHVEEKGIYNISRAGFFRHTLLLNDIESSLKSLQPMTDAVEKECPFAKTFGITGRGEGIVWKALQPSKDTNFWLKVKGPLFTNRPISNKEEERLEKLEKVEQVKSFAERVCGDWRLEQGWQYLDEMEVKRDNSGVKAFLNWINHDIELEEKGEIAKMKMDKMGLRKQIGQIAKPWYLKRVQDERHDAKDEKRVVSGLQELKV